MPLNVHKLPIFAHLRTFIGTKRLIFFLNPKIITFEKMLDSKYFLDDSEKHVLIFFFRFYQPILTRLGALFWKFYSPYLVFETQNAIYTGSGSNSPISGFYLFFPTTLSHLDPRNVPYGKRYVVDVMR